jgi:hypothetical protein
LPRRQWHRAFIDEDPDYIEQRNGVLSRGLRFTYCDEDIEMIQQGYKCIDCGEVMRDEDGPFPQQCFVCGFPMRDRQTEQFATMFAGWRPMGPQTDWDEEMDRMERERYERLRAEGLRSKGVYLPRKRY